MLVSVNLPEWVVLLSASTPRIFLTSSGLLPMQDAASASSFMCGNGRGLEQLERRFGVDVVASSSPIFGDDSGGEQTARVGVAAFRVMGADMLGRRTTPRCPGAAPSSLGSSTAGPATKFSLLHTRTLCWINLTMSPSAKDFWQEPQVRMSWGHNSASAATKIKTTVMKSGERKRKNGRWKL